MKPFDTDKMPWLFTPHGDGELNEYFSTDHSKIIAETSKEVLASLSESRDKLSGKLCYEFHYNQRRYKYTLLRFADMIVRADVSIKKLKKRIMELDIDNRESLETAIWEDLWNGKGDNGLDYPEASYKHHLLDKWLDENYGTGGYDWTDVGEVTHGYRRYYRDLIDGWDFEDDNSGNWTIDTEDNHYSFYMLNGMWQMIDQNGDTVDTFPPFSTLEEDEPEAAGGHEINDDVADSPRVIGEVTGRTETDSEGLADVEGEVTAADSGEPCRRAIC